MASCSVVAHDRCLLSALRSAPLRRSVVRAFVSHPSLLSSSPCLQRTHSRCRCLSAPSGVRSSCRGEGGEGWGGGVGWGGAIVCGQLASGQCLLGAGGAAASQSTFERRRCSLVSFHRDGHRLRHSRRRVPAGAQLLLVPASAPALLRSAPVVTLLLCIICVLTLMLMCTCTCAHHSLSVCAHMTREHMHAHEEHR